MNITGPAFPTDGTTMDDGMTLRDYFAAAALQGLLASDAGVNTERGEVPWFHVNGGAATRAYLLADAMLAERAK